MTDQVSVRVADSEYARRDCEQYLICAGGRIVCLRCQAKSSRTKEQCKKPALKASRTQKCGHHGGGPKKLRLKHGLDTIAARAERAKEAALLRRLEDALHLLGIINGPRTPGRKPKAYRAVRTHADLRQMMLSDGIER